MQVYQNPEQNLWQAMSRRPVLETDVLEAAVKSIFARVAAEGDEALCAYTRQFDKVKLSRLVIPLDKVRTMASSLPSATRQAIDTAYDNIYAFHVTQVPALEREAVMTMPGVVCWGENRPIKSVGLYIPGGSAPLISTVLMLGVPAQLAGCQDIVLCTPPAADGLVNPAICYAATKVGITRLVTLGGAQAIAAMAIGTQSISKVDKIFGPGNQYVTAGKQLAPAYGTAYDMPAGPSEVLVLADGTAKPQFVAADLLSQAEHGPDSQVSLVTTDPTLVSKVQKELRTQLSILPRAAIARKSLKSSFAITFPDLDVAISFANQYAPEHLILSVKNSRQRVAEIQNAGSVFLGNYSPESAGDYASGTNHTLPTGGWAKSYGGVSLNSFVKKVTFQELTRAGLNNLGQTITSLAEAEGLMAHARAVSIRLKEK